LETTFNFFKSILVGEKMDIKIKDYYFSHYDNKVDVLLKFENGETIFFTLNLGNKEITSYSGDTRYFSWLMKNRDEILKKFEEFGFW